MNLWRDLRCAFRQLWRTPWYAISTLAILSLAMAATSAVAGAAFALLTSPDAIQRPRDLIVAWSTAPARNAAVVEVTYRQFETWGRSSTLSHAAAFSSSHWPMVLDSGPERLRLAASAVSASFFDTLGAQPLLGRAFTAADDALRSGWVAVLSDRAWKSRFSADPAVVGSTIALDGKVFTIIGVTPEGFDFPKGTDLWTPVVPLLTEVSERNDIDAFEQVGVLYVLGRAHREWSDEAVRSDFQRFIVGDVGGGPQQRRAVVVPFVEHVLGPFRTGAWWLIVAAVVLLLVTCANFSALALTRALANGRHDAIRLALGASRSALVRHWFLESAAIATLSLVIGFAVSKSAMSVIVALAPDDLPGLADVALNAPVAVATIVIAGVAAALWAAAPMLATHSLRPVEMLRDRSRATPVRRVQRFRASLVIAQIGLSVTLLVITGLIVRSFVNVQQLDLGFTAERVLTLHVEPSDPADRSGAWFQALTARLEDVPGVEAAGAVLLRPLVYGPIGSDELVILRGQSETLEAALTNPQVSYQVATPGYFRAMRIPLVRGRLFDDRDRDGAVPVVVVGESAARALWPGQEAVGRQLAMPSLARANPIIWRTVVGVVNDVHYRGLGDVRLDVYEPAAQAAQPPESLVVRTAGSPLSVAAAVQAAVRETDARAIISGMATLESIVSRAVAPWRMVAWTLGFAAALTFLLALVGLVGQLGVELTHRRPEFAIRLAVGAKPADIQLHVLRGTAIRVLIGVCIGAATAVGATGSIDALLFRVTALDPATWVIALSATCLSTAGVALAISRRAATVSPASLLSAP